MTPSFILSLVINVGFPTNTTAVFGDYVVLPAPSGGWTWAKIQALEVTFWSNVSISTVSIYKIEIFVEHTTGSEKLPVDFMIGISAGTDDTGGREIFCADAWCMLLHVPVIIFPNLTALSEGIMGEQNSYEGPFEIT